MVPQIVYFACDGGLYGWFLKTALVLSPEALTDTLNFIESGPYFSVREFRLQKDYGYRDPYCG